MKSGTVQDGEFWIRCPFCGDSQNNPTKAHFSIRLRDGAYHCHRCNAGGRLSASRLLEITHKAGEAPVMVSDLERDDDDPLPELIPGPASTRYSRLRRFHMNTPERKLDAFELFDPIDLELVGIAYRAPNYARIVGDKGLAWPYAPDPLVSHSLSPLRLVEGPYDVLGANDVATFGTFARSTLEDLKGHFIILTPDGDVWTDGQLFFQFMGTVSWLMKPQDRFAWGTPQLKPHLLGIEYIKGEKDPDEVYPDDREFLDRGEVLELLREYRKRRV